MSDKDETVTIPKREYLLLLDLQRKYKHLQDEYHTGIMIAALLVVGWFIYNIFK